MRQIVTVGVAAALLALSPSLQAAPLVTNGSFATGTLSGWTATGTVIATNVGATASSGGSGSATPSTFAEFGSTSNTIFNGLPTSNSLSQSIATVAGTNYLLTFAYGAFGNSRTGVNGMIAFSAVGTSHTTSSSTSAPPDTNFANVFGGNSLFFIADGATTTINFVDTSTGNGNSSTGSTGSNGVLTSVNVANVPEPVTMTLMLTAIVGLGAVRLRKSA